MIKYIFYILLLPILFGCSKNYITVCNGDHNNCSSDSLPTEGDINNPSYLVKFNPYVLSISGSVDKPSTSPLAENRYVSIYAYSNNSFIKSAKYITNSPGVLTPYGGNGMVLPLGNYMLYAVSTNSNTDLTPTIDDAIATNITNGVDYLYWNSTSPELINSDKNLIVNLGHACSQIVIKIEYPSTITFNKIDSATIDQSNIKGSSWNIRTGVITPATSLASDLYKMGSTDNYVHAIMIPLIYNNDLNFNLSATINNELIPRQYTAQLPLVNGILKEGESYLYTLNIDEFSISKITVNVIDWITVVAGDPIIPTPI